LIEYIDIVKIPLGFLLPQYTRSNEIETSSNGAYHLGRFPHKNKMFLLLYYRLIIGIVISCRGACNTYNLENRRQCFKRLQSDIQIFAHEEFMTNDNVSYSKWIIEKHVNNGSSKIFKVHIYRFCYSEVLRNDCFLVGCRCFLFTAEHSTSISGFCT
jgi:hypothetical protein